MRNYVAEHFSRHPGPVRPVMKVASGETLSVQASECHYCSPREDVKPSEYTSVEVWCWQGDEPPDWLKPYSEEGDPAGWVPVELVNQWVERSGGMAA